MEKCMFVKTMGSSWWSIIKKITSPAEKPVFVEEMCKATQWLVWRSIIKDYIANNICRLTVDNIVYIMHAKYKNNCSPAIVWWMPGGKVHLQQSMSLHWDAWRCRGTRHLLLTCVSLICNSHFQCIWIWLPTSVIFGPNTGQLATPLIKVLLDFLCMTTYIWSPCHKFICVSQV